MAVTGDYPAIVATFLQWTWLEWFAGGMMAAWLIYALGRFALGAAIGRTGILDDVPGHLSLLRRIFAIAVPSGLAIGFLIQLVVLEVWTFDSDWPKSLAQSFRSPAALLLAAGYSAGIVIALHSRRGARLLGIFAPVGRMALTNYLMQGFLYAVVLFGVGPGLGLAGRIGAGAVVLMCIAFFALQTLLSHWWLARFRFGPMEWLWRALTYGEVPPFRRVKPVAAAIA